jgi:hypothetical protein
VYKYNKGLKVFGGMYVLFYLDSTLCTCGGSIVLLVKKGAKISMDEGAKQCNEEDEETSFFATYIEEGRL